jgi:hypothetical protein
MSYLRVDTDVCHKGDEFYPRGGLPTPESSICDGRRSSFPSSHWSFESIGSSTSSHSSSIASYQSSHCSQEPATPPQHGLPMDLSFIAPGTSYDKYSQAADHPGSKGPYLQGQTMLHSLSSSGGSPFDFHSESQWDYCSDQREAYGSHRLPLYATNGMMPASGDFASAIGACLNQLSQNIEHNTGDPLTYHPALTDYQNSINMPASDTFRSNFQHSNRASSTIPSWPYAIGSILPSSARVDDTTIVPKETVMYETFSTNAHTESPINQESGMLSPCSDRNAVKDEDVSSDGYDSWYNGPKRKVVVSRYGAKGLKREEKRASAEWTPKSKRSGTVNKRRPKPSKTLSAMRTLNGGSVSICYQECGKNKKYACTHILPDGSRCPREFERVEHLRRHHGTHSGVREHSCPDCKKEFGRRDNWRAHLQTHLTQTIAGRNDRRTFEEIFTLLRATEETEEAEKTIASLKKWRESGKHLSKGSVHTSACVS